MKEYVTIIDIGTTKIVALAAERQNESIRILGSGKVKTPKDAVKRGVVLNIRDVSNAIKKAVSIAEEQSKVKFVSAHIGIAGQHIKSQHTSYSSVNIEGDEITSELINEMKNSVRQTVTNADEDIIHVIPRNYTIDNEPGITNPIGMNGKQIVGNYHLVIGATNSSNNIRRCIESLNIKVNGMILEPLASAVAVLNKEEQEIGNALVDIGGGTTDVAVFFNNTIYHTAVIPYGGDIVTKDLAVALKVPYQHAESLKIKAGKAAAKFADPNTYLQLRGINNRKPKRIAQTEVAKVIESRVSELVKMIHYQIKNAGIASGLGTGITLTGGGALLENIGPFITEKIGIETTVASPRVSLIKGVDELNDPRYSTSVGLIEYAFDGYYNIEHHSDSFENIEKKERKLAQEREQAKNTYGIVEDQEKKPEPEEDLPEEDEVESQNHLTNIVEKISNWWKKLEKDV